MLYRLLLSDIGFIAGLIIEAVLTVVAIILMILVLKFGLPNFEKRERVPKQKKEKSQPITYAVAYVSGGALGNAPPVEQYRKGAKVVLKSNMFASPAGKLFEGWWDGSKKYSAGTKFSMPEHAVTLTASWIDIPKEEPKKEVEKAPEKEEKAVKEETTTKTIKTDDVKMDVVVTNPDGTPADDRPIIVNVYNTTPTGSSEKTVEKQVTHIVEKEEIDNEGLEFSDYTILQLYDMLTDEQKRYFDTLKEAALAKPEAKLMPGRSFLNIKIGKRSILKLRIRRMVTVGEYSLENDILKDFRKASDNKAGNAKIKVRPTLVAVTDKATLETALNMIDLVYKQVLES